MYETLLKIVSVSKNKGKILCLYSDSSKDRGTLYLVLLEDFHSQSFHRTNSALFFRTEEVMNLRHLIKNNKYDIFN